MSSAKKFSQTLIRMGKNAKFAKSDLVDAYKLIPCHPSDWKFYGFKWLGKFFIDTTSPFGLTGAPAGFDDFGETACYEYYSNYFQNSESFDPSTTR